MPTSSLSHRMGEGGWPPVGVRIQPLWELQTTNPAVPFPVGYVFTVAAGILPAVEPGILPGGYAGVSPSIPRPEMPFRAARCRPLRQPGWPPPHTRLTTVNTYTARGNSRRPVRLFERFVGQRPRWVVLGGCGGFSLSPRERAWGVKGGRACGGTQDGPHGEGPWPKWQPGWDSRNRPLR